MQDHDNGSTSELNLLWGAEAIARALGITRRRAFHLLEGGHLPAKKVGRTWVASLEKLREAVA